MSNNDKPPSTKPVAGVQGGECRGGGNSNDIRGNKQRKSEESVHTDVQEKTEVFDIFGTKKFADFDVLHGKKFADFDKCAKKFA